MEAQRDAKDLCGFESALQVARVESGEPPVGEPAGQERGLAAPFGRKGRVELALDPVLAIPRRLTMPDEDKARGFGTRW